MVKRKKYVVFIAVLLCFLLPAGVFFLQKEAPDFSLPRLGRGWTVRSYYLAALVILICGFLVFSLIYERRRPQARELVVLSVLVALGVAGRALFAWLPQFKPVLALVILSGLSFGGGAGFLVGAMTAFVSNFFFGQGAWTPWQMLAFGLIGLLAGLLSNRKGWSENRIALCFFGAGCALFIYGPILNTVNVFLYQQTFSWGYLKASFVTGFPFDCIHALSTAIFLALLGGAFLRKLSRVQLKYGVFEKRIVQSSKK